MLATSGAGGFMMRDELAAFFGGFGRYSRGGGAPERAFYLQSYDGGPYSVHRATKPPVFIDECGLTVYGHIQPTRLDKFLPDLLTDGLLQRFIVVLPTVATVAKPLNGKITGKAKFDTAINTLLELKSLYGREYHPHAQACIDRIRKMERDALALTELSDYGLGFSGFCGKLHGTTARIAFVLHLLDYPDAEMKIIAAETVERADQLSSDSEVGTQ
jgi:hypothetical protein